MFLPSLITMMTLITVMRETAFLSLAGCSDHMSHEAIAAPYRGHALAPARFGGTNTVFSAITVISIITSIISKSEILVKAAPDHW